ncbi:hypothetical protein [Arthrobacter sp. ok362]|uniref:hypothetical protein n=1 Tax=Arthrobacter sp. ok362 TaxID=1761745 RepID=UPI001113E28C|nr:hypothetical protein [Arthrobacter sp. ok362]
MWIVVLLAIALVVVFWNYILIGLGLWVCARIVRAFIILTVADSKPNRRPAPRPVQTRPVAKPVHSRPVAKPARALPAADYLPRWNADRRLDARREHVEWQKEFDQASYLSETAMGRGSTRG